MDLTERAAPPPGTAAPGNLYADLQSRTLWLGVDPAVDPAAAVLVSDIVALMEEIDDSLVTAKAYTDTQITTRAPTVHTHTSTQITDFTAAVTAIAMGIPSLRFTKKMIMMWSGTLPEIGVGDLAGWALCDGSNGTPDLRDKFVLGAGNKVIGAGNTSTQLETDTKGQHVHTITGTAITVAQMASHNHGANTGFVSADHAHFVNINSGTESHDHAHGGVLRDAGTRIEGGSWAAHGGSPGGSDGRNQAHWHNVQGWTGGINANHQHAVTAEGGGQAHTHAESYAGDHSHVMPLAAVREGVPYYALAFIMKL